jgi:SAM-dependent methyltransferase
VETGQDGTGQSDTANFSAGERRQRASSFGSAASQYAQHRPRYAAAAIRWCLEPVGQERGIRVIDIGAGTGILTAGILAAGAEAVAVEPDADMLAELRRQLPEVQAVAGSAEAIPLPDDSADAVLCGQAMHWFDLDRALPEIARVLRPGGVFAGLWNADDDRVGWVAGLADMVDSPRLSSWHSEPDADSDSEILRTGSSWFAPVQEREFAADGQARTAASLVETIATHSKFLVMAEPERSHALGRVRDYLSRQPETSNGEFTLPLVTVAVRAVSR